MLRALERSQPATIAGTAIYLTANPGFAPVSLMHSLKHFKSLHERNIVLTVVTADVPRVDDRDRVRAERINARFWRVTMTFGFMEEPNLPAALEACPIDGWTFDIMTTSFLVSRRSLKPAARGALPAWQSRLFIFLARNAADASAYFHIPAGRVVEIGSQVTL